MKLKYFNDSKGYSEIFSETREKSLILIYFNCRSRCRNRRRPMNCVLDPTSRLLQPRVSRALRQSPQPRNFSKSDLGAPVGAKGNRPQIPPQLHPGHTHNTLSQSRASTRNSYRRGVLAFSRVSAEANSRAPTRRVVEKGRRNSAKSHFTTMPMVSHLITAF